MLRHDRQRERYRAATNEAEWEEESGSAGSSRSEQGGAGWHSGYPSRDHAPRLVDVTQTDSSGRTLPSAERAPLPKNLK